MNVMRTFAMLLQEATNRLFFRRFEVALGILKDRGPAIVLTTKRLVGENQRLLIDVNSFLQVAKEMAETDAVVLESRGFVINKKDKMDREFVIPPWAFPRALYETLLCAENILRSFKEMQDSMDKMLGLMKSAGIPEEELEKFRQSIVNPNREKTTVH